MKTDPKLSMSLCLTALVRIVAVKGPTTWLHFRSNGGSERQNDDGDDVSELRRVMGVYCYCCRLRVVLATGRYVGFDVFVLEFGSL